MPTQCATCGETISGCGCGNKICDFCNRNGHEVEIYNECPILGTICIDCENSGEHTDYWGN